MIRWTKRIALILLCTLALLLYREWVARHAPRLSMPLGFFETSMTGTTPEEAARNPELWQEPLSSIVIEPAAFEAQALAARAQTLTGSQILVFGASIGGVAGSLAAADDNASVTLVSASRHAEDEWIADASLLLEELDSTSNRSGLERLIRGRLGALYPTANTSVNGIPSDISTLLRAQMTSKNVRLLEGYTPVAFTGTKQGRLDRALLQSQNGTSIVIPFAFMLDATQTGELYALTGAPHDVGLTARETSQESDALPQRAITALAEGYSQSGHTIAGMGYRLDGGMDIVALVDRGVYGRLVQSSSDDPCWLKDAKTVPFIMGDTVWRAQRQGCERTYDVTSPSEDIVDLFILKDGNDSIDATVFVGKNLVPFSVRTPAPPNDPLVFIGSFPLGAQTPLRVTMRSALPTDKFESLVVRKRNTSYSTQVSVPEVNNTAHVSFRGWIQTEVEVWISLSEDVGSPELVIGDARFPLQLVGNRTWRTARIPMPNGQSMVRIEGAKSINGVLAVPIQPVRAIAQRFDEENRATAVPATFLQYPNIAEHSWETTVETDGEYLFSTNISSCGDFCAIAIGKRDAITPFSTNELRLSDAQQPMYAALDIVHLEAGTPYVFTFASANGAPPDIGMTLMGGTGADLFHVATGLSYVAPANSGLYDIWIRSAQSTSVSVDAGTTSNKLEIEPGKLTYFGVQQLSPAVGLSVRGGGSVSVLAVPNTHIDTYRHIILPSSDETEAPVEAPAGSVSAWLEGEAPPSFVSFRERGGNVQQVTFQDDGHIALSPFSHDGTSPLTVVVPPQQTSMELVLHESISLSAARTPAPPAILQAIAPTMLWNVPMSVSGPIATKGSGVLLVQVSRAGIGPVTLGLLQTNSLSGYIGAEATRTVHAMRATFVREFCNDMPDCDPRRFAPAAFIFDTPDGHLPSPVRMDGRRLRTEDTLTMSGTFLRETTCTSACALVCVDPPDSAGRCISKEQETDIGVDTILTVDGTYQMPSLMSPDEEANSTLKGLLNLMRTDELLASDETYLERGYQTRPIQLTVGMFSSPTAQYLLPANWTIGATHGASRALRSARSRMAIGEAAANIATFSLHTNTTPSAISHDTSLLESLRVHMIERGVHIFPIHEGAEDPLLLKAIQRMLLQGKAKLMPTWSGRQLAYGVDVIQQAGPDPELLELLIGAQPQTVQSLIRTLAKKPEMQGAEVFRTGIDMGLFPPKMLNLGIAEILQLPADTSMLLKGYELLLNPIKEY